MKTRFAYLVLAVFVIVMFLNPMTRTVILFFTLAPLLVWACVTVAIDIEKRLK